MTRYKFFIGDIKSESIIREDIKELLKTSKDVLYKIPKSEEYRPDLIANRFYGDPKLFWVLVYANNFANSPEDFIVNKTIRIPYYGRVMEIL